MIENAESPRVRWPAPTAPPSVPARGANCAPVDDRDGTGAGRPRGVVGVGTGASLNVAVAGSLVLHKLAGLV